jgi:protein-L-isoaspartate O-methyltransferase
VVPFVCVNISRSVPPSDPQTPYALGYTDAEHKRLIRQAAVLAPLTERFFRDSGIGPGQRVLDLGSGVGDVAMLVARIVGPLGEGIGIERDSTSIAIASARVAESGLRNVSFAQSDASQITTDKPFDAAVGRFILQFLPDPASVLRSLSQLVRPGGVIAFLEAQWDVYLSIVRPLPLFFACASTVREAFHRSGVRTDLGVALHGVFQQAGLPAPTMRMEMSFGASPEFVLWICDLLRSLLPKINHYGIPLDNLGELDTLAPRVLAEVASANSAVPFIALVGAFSSVSG